MFDVDDVLCHRARIIAINDTMIVVIIAITIVDDAIDTMTCACCIIDTIVDDANVIIAIVAIVVTTRCTNTIDDVDTCASIVVITNAMIDDNTCASIIATIDDATIVIDAIVIVDA